MLYVIAVVCPPLAVLISGRKDRVALSVGLWLLGVVPGVIHAFLVINEAKQKYEEDHYVEKDRSELSYSLPRIR